jgi:aryl-alcohol dehydrogenase-like predicted oxidoreductase
VTGSCGGAAGRGGVDPPANPFAQLDLTTLRVTLAEIAGRHGRSAAQVALAWALQRDGVAGAIVGVRNLGEAEELPGAADLRLEPAELEALQASAP